jgi:hypothetical protein
VKHGKDFIQEWVDAAGGCDQEWREMAPERNDPCPCGSGRKYKKCCLAKDEAEVASALAQAARAGQEEERRAKEEAEENRKKWDAEHEARQAARAAEQPAVVPRDEFADYAEFQASCEEEFGWPPLPPEEQQLYSSEKGPGRADRLLERVLAFLDQQPTLFRYLCLHDGFLDEVGNALTRCGRTEDHCALLRRLRAEQPEVYLTSFGFWDLLLLTEALRTERREDVSACLTLYRQHPFKFIDQFVDAVDLLAWHGCEVELRDLLEATAKDLADSAALFDGGFGKRWLTTLAMVPVLEAGDDSPAALEAMCEQVMAVRYLRDDEANREWVRHSVRMALPTEEAANLDLDRPHSIQYDGDVSWSFTGWLTRTKGLRWASARFLAEAMLNYWFWAERGMKDAKKAARKNVKRGESKNPLPNFGLKPGRLRKYLDETCISFFGLKTLTALPAIQGFHYFAEYLVAHGYLDDDAAGKLQAAAKADFELIRQACGARDPFCRIYPTFEDFISGD